MLGCKRTLDTEKITTKHSKTAVSGKSTYYGQGSISERTRSSDESSFLTSPLTTSHMESNCISDMTISERYSDLPIVIFEAKSNGKPSTVSGGMIQLVSFGLSLRHNKKIPYKLKLVLITPRGWFVSSLPPYSKEVDIEEICFDTYLVLAEFNDETFFDRSAYIGFLSNLRQHFEAMDKHFSNK